MLNEEEIMNWDEYTDWVEDKVSTHGHARLVENTLGLVGEAGEVAEKVKKYVRDAAVIPDFDTALVKELGDVLFYVTALASYYGYSLEAVMKMNVEKLNSRQARGVLGGSGDNR